MPVLVTSSIIVWKLCLTLEAENT